MERTITIKQLRLKLKDMEKEYMRYRQETDNDHMRSYYLGKWDAITSIMGLIS